MKTITFEVPALFGDHHVTEIRRILLEVEGVKDVYASSAFQIVEVTYNEKKVNNQQIEAKLDEAGYLGEWKFPAETGVAAQQGDGSKPFFRHTTTYETIKQNVGFAQRVNYQGRPLWPCPGIGAIKMEEVENG